MAHSGQHLRDRLAAFLRREFSGPSRDKRLASRVHCDVRSARNLFDGHWPNDATLQSIIMEFGEAALDAVFRPDLDAQAARADAEIRQIEEALHVAQAARRSLESRSQVRPRSSALG